MNQNRVNGTIDQTVGAAKRKAGELTDNPKLQAKGIAQQLKGKIESALGQAQEAVENVIGTTELRVDGHVALGMKTSSANLAFTKKGAPAPNANPAETK